MQKTLETPEPRTAAAAKPQSAKAAAATTDLSTVKHRRRPWLWVIAILMIATGSLLVGTVINMVKDTTPVLATAQSITRGDIITEEHLATVEVHPEPGLVTIPAAERANLIGQTALTDIPQGQLVNPAAMGEGLLPGHGESLVGVAVTPPQRPGQELRPGTEVLLVSTPRTGDDLVEDGSRISIDGVVVSASVSPDTNLTVVDVAVPNEVAEQLAALSATGRVALIVKGLS